MPNKFFASLRLMVKETGWPDWCNKEIASASTLGQRIALARKVRGWSSVELARRAKVTKAAVSDWESGKTKNLRLDNLFALCDLLNINARWLSTGAGVPTRQLIQSDEESELLVVYRELNKGAQKALLGVARAMHAQEAGGAPTRVAPFKETASR